jgi:hypothetical protein
MVGWLRRKTCIVSGSAGAGTGYQIRVHIHYGSGVDSGEDVYCSGQCQSDFSDIRFVSSDNQTVLNYWVQSVTVGDNAVFWVKINDNLDTAKTVYLNYGNMGVGSLSSQANTFVDVIGGVVGAWNMEEAAAIDPVLDYSGNGNDGTPTGTTVVSNKFAGKTARSFDGASKIDCGNDSTLDLVDGLTLVAWVKLTDNLNHNAVFSRGFSDAAGGYCFTILQTTGAINCWAKAENYGWQHSITDTSWHFIYYTLKTGVNNVAMSKDNSFLDTFTTTKILSGASANNATIAYDPNGLFFKGAMSNLCLFSTSLSTNQLTNIYQNYPDVSLEAGKVLVRKYVYPEPAPSAWSS